MARTERKHLTKTVVDAARPRAARDRFVWDADAGPRRRGVVGLGLRVRPSGHKSFVLQYRLNGRPKRVSLGLYGDLTVQEARDEARKRKAEIREGKDPVEERRRSREGDVTVRGLAERFMAEHASKRSTSTERNYRLLWDNYVVPALGSKAVEEVTWADVARLHHKMRKTPYAANRMLALVSKAWSLAQKWGWFPRDTMNPGREHDRYPERRDRGSSLAVEELRALGKALDEESGAGAEVIRLTVLCGARPKEIRELRWDDLEAKGRVATLKQAKTGPRRIYFGSEAAKVIARQPRVGPYVFPKGDPGKRQGRARFDPNEPVSDLRRVWQRVKKRAELDSSVRLYDATRHTFATWAEELGVETIRRKRLVGHSVADITAGYTHTRQQVLLADADRVSGFLAAAMEGKQKDVESGEVALS